MRYLYFTPGQRQHWSHPHVADRCREGTRGVHGAHDCADVVSKVPSSSILTSFLITPILISFHLMREQEADRKVAELDTSRELSRTWLHVDMDAFFTFT